MGDATAANCKDEIYHISKLCFYFDILRKFYQLKMSEIKLWQSRKTAAHFHIKAALTINILRNYNMCHLSYLLLHNKPLQNIDD